MWSYDKFFAKCPSEPRVTTWGPHRTFHRAGKQNKNLLESGPLLGTYCELCTLVLQVLPGWSGMSGKENPKLMPGYRVMKTIRTVVWFGWKEKCIIKGCLEWSPERFEVQILSLLYYTRKL